MSSLPSNTTATVRTLADTFLPALDGSTKGWTASAAGLGWPSGFRTRVPGSLTTMFVAS